MSSLFPVVPKEIRYEQCVVESRAAVYQAAGFVYEASVPASGVFEPVSVDENLSSGGEPGRN